MLDIHTHTHAHTQSPCLLHREQSCHRTEVLPAYYHTHTHTHTHALITHTVTHTQSHCISHTHTLHITQGAELSQDRGRMQAETESLRAQHKEAQLQLTSDKDALRIKECQVTGELESINYV